MLRIHQAALLLSCALSAAGVFPRSAAAEEIVGLSQPLGAPVLIRFDSRFATIPLDLRFVIGVAPGQGLAAIDIRPATGAIYGVGVRGTQAQLYLINARTGAATPVGPVFEGLAGGTGAVRYGLDFNPVIDRVRLVSSSGQNVVFHPDTGVVTPATSLRYGEGDPNASAAPAVADIAYDRNVAGTTATQQRGIDTELDVLVTVANNAGTLGTIGPLGVDAVSVGGYDVSGATGTGCAVITAKRPGLLGRLGLSSTSLYQLDPATGAATPVGISPLVLVPIGGMTVVP